MMELSGRIALLVFAGALAGLVGWSAARAADATTVANDPVAFERMRAELARRQEQKEDARRPVQPARKQQSANACVIKPVMTDAEIDACRRK